MKNSRKDFQEIMLNLSFSICREFNMRRERIVGEIILNVNTKASS
jgi:hypothetical protein